MSGSAPALLLFSRDPDVASRFAPLLGYDRDLMVLDQYPDFQREASRRGPCVVLLDVRVDRQTPEPELILREFPDHLFLALGIPRSAPMRTAAVSSMFAAEDVHAPPRHIARTVALAQQVLDLRIENRKLREQIPFNIPKAPALQPPPSSGSFLGTRDLIRLLRVIDDPEILQEHLLEEVVSSLHLTRAGLLLKDRSGGSFSVQSGNTLLPGTLGTSFAITDPFILWMERHAHMISRQSLGAVASGPGEHLLLQRVLDQLGAEVLVPLRGRQGVLGAYFCGRPLSGYPLEQEDLDQLLLAADLIAVSIERALLHREIQMQHSRAETLLKELPIGVIYADPDGMVKWCSPAADRILSIRPHPEHSRRIGDFGEAVNRVANEISSGVELLDPISKRPLRLSAVQVRAEDHDAGVLVMIEDRQQEYALKEKQGRLDRETFWTRLAASMSHEVRNPLVAINTFAQLLPERYQDAEFREEFSDMVRHEVEKLGNMIDQINAFAHPPELVPKAVDIRPLLQQAAEKARSFEDGPHVFEHLAPSLPPVHADEAALASVLDHLLKNAVEALSGRNGEIMIHASEARDLDGNPVVEIDVHDNGQGIPDEIQDDPFSPFTTIKAQGLGLGLAIAHRTLQDLDGSLRLSSTPRGTSVTFVLPVATQELTS